MRTYFDIRTPILPGWRLPSGVKVRRGVTSDRSPFFGKTDIVVAYPGPKEPNPRKWKELPHLALANLGYSKDLQFEMARTRKASNKAFADNWGKRDTQSRNRLEEASRASIAHSYSGHQPTAEEVGDFVLTYGRLFEDPAGEANSVCEVSVAEFRDLQERVRDVWRRHDAKLLWFQRGSEELDNFDLPFTWREDDDSLILRPADVWTYLRLLLTRDLASGHAKVCKYPQCDAPFCVKERTDGECCSHECAVKFTNWKNSLRRKRAIESSRRRS